MSKKNATSPAATMVEYDLMLPAWEKIQTVLSGTEAMRKANRTYLPQHDKESDLAYSERLGRCTLLNLTKLTLESWVGRPFSEPVTLKDDVPKQIVDLAENIDTLGSSLNVFTRNWFKEGISKAYSHVLVDMPRLGEPEGRVRSLEDDRREGVRPYWVHIQPENLFFAESQTVNGEDRLMEIRFFETVSVREGFAIASRQRIRRLYLNSGVVTVEVWERARVKGKVVWAVVDQYDMGIDEIPLVTFYADREQFMYGKSPVEDLADLNIAHWQSTSDQRAILTVARFPILACSGGTDDTNKITLSPFKWLYCPDPQGRFYYVEHSGAAIEVGAKDLESLEQQMGEYGAEFLKKRPGRETATARILDTSESTSPLQDMVLRFQDAVEEALELTAKWLGLGGEAGGSIKIKTDFADAPDSPTTLQTLQKAREDRDISRETFLKELKRYKVLEEDFDIDEDFAKLELELLSAVPMPEPPSTKTPGMDMNTNANK